MIRNRIVELNYSVDDETLESLETVGSNIGMSNEDVLGTAITYDCQDDFEGHHKLLKTVNMMAIDNAAFPPDADMNIEIKSNKVKVRMAITQEEFRKYIDEM